jgi:hypothetical protein
VADATITDGPKKITAEAQRRRAKKKKTEAGRGFNGLEDYMDQE